MLVRYEYDVFGAIRSETGTSDDTRKFTGKEFDADSNLYYYGARYYDPYIGRFTQRDPVGDGVNWYAYTYNNPLRFIDPDGLRGLNQAETDAATDFFGDMINLEQVDIKESGFRYNIVRKITPYLVVHNDIYGKFYHQTNAKGEIIQVHSKLIHELFHVWQYAQGRLNPVVGLITHAIAWATGQREELYDYHVDHLLDPERKTLREYSFEEQAAIVEDAYRVLVLGEAPFHNKDDWRLSLDDWREYYEQFMYEFRQWHQELQQSSSSSYPNDN